MHGVNICCVAADGMSKRVKSTWNDRNVFHTDSSMLYCCDDPLTSQWAHVGQCTFAGSFSSLAASTSVVQCVSCSGGQFSAAGASQCTACPAFATDINRLSCQCPAGYRRVDGASGSFTCEECPAGTYASTAGSTTCVACPAGELKGSPSGRSVRSVGPYGGSGPIIVLLCLISEAQRSVCVCVCVS